VDTAEPGFLTIGMYKDVGGDYTLLNPTN